MTLRAADDERVRISAVIVTYNSAKVLPTLLESLDDASSDVHAIVVDNDSADETTSVIRSIVSCH